MTRSEHDEYESLAVGWALHALEPAEESGFADHLATCERCQQAVQESEQALGELAYDVPLIDPPPGLLHRIHEATGATRAEPEADERPRAALVVSLADRRRVLRWGAPAMAAALALIALLGWNIVLHNRVAQERQLAAQRQQVIHELANSNLRASLRDPGGRPVGYVLQQGSEVKVVADGLRPNDPGRTTYVLWALPGSNSTPRAVGRFDVATGRFEIRSVTDAAGSLTDVTGFAVSREPGRVVPPRPSVVIASGAVQT